MYKEGDKVVFRDNSTWKSGIFEIGEVKSYYKPLIHNGLSINSIRGYKYSIKYKTTNSRGEIIDIYSSTWHSAEEFMSLKESRKLKLEKINEEYG
jgi:hypothetical protein